MVTHLEEHRIALQYKMAKIVIFVSNSTATSNGCNVGTRYLLVCVWTIKMSYGRDRYYKVLSLPSCKFEMVTSGPHLNKPKMYRIKQVIRPKFIKLIFKKIALKI